MTAKRGRPKGGSPISMIKADHKRVKDLYKKYQEVEIEEKEELAKDILRELDVHAMLEEEIFYPAVEEAGDDEEKTLIAKSLAEHKSAKALIEELQALSVDDRDFMPKFELLMKDTQHHVQMEEKELLPRAKRILAQDLEEIGQEMKKRRESLEEAGQGIFAPPNL